MNNVLKKKVWITSFFIVGVLLIGTDAIADGNDDVVGKWAFEAPSAPYGYHKGFIHLKVDEGVLVGEVEFPDSYKIKLKKVELKGKKLTMGLYVDYEYINIEAEIVKNKMEGYVDTPDGKLKITANKQ